MLKADPGILQCEVRRLARNESRKRVCRKAVVLMGVGSGHLIFELDSGEEFTDTRKLNGCLMVRAPKVDTTWYLYIVVPGKAESWISNRR
jgi:hypothetical protein